jgi:Mn2+/Fe2+ NRAMP family transporter
MYVIRKDLAALQPAGRTRDARALRCPVLNQSGGLDLGGGTVVPGPFLRPVERRSVLDRAHRGDVEGAFGRVASHEVAPTGSRRRRLATLLAVMGPGLIVMAGDNEAGSLSVYGQAGQNYGMSLVWLLLPLAGMLFVNQEMVARLGAVTGAGHARLIYERFGRRWGTFAVFDLLILALLTVVTEFVGVDLAASYLGVNRYVAVPLAAAALIAATASGSFPRWERLMYVLVGFNVLVVPLAIVSRPQPLGLAQGLVPGLSGGLTESSVIFIVALAGATVTPWQLFFQQSNVVDKRITGRWLAYERADTLVGTFAFALVAIAVMAACAFAFDGSTLHGGFVDAGEVTRGLASRLGHPAGVLFALILLNGSILGALVVTLGASYAIGDVFGVNHSLHRRWNRAPTFYGAYAAVVVVAAAVVLAPGAPLGAVTTAVQALAGVLLPSALVFLVLMCNDQEVLGPWVNPRWLNVVAVVSIGLLLLLSALVTFTTLFPDLPIGPLTLALAGALAAILAILAGTTSWRRQPDQERVSFWSRASWTMPPFETLAAPPRSRGREIGLVLLRAYLTLAAVAVVVATIRSTLGS